MGEAKRRINLAEGGVIPKNPKKMPAVIDKDLPMVQVIPNQTSGDDLLLRRITLGEVFTMSDGTKYIFDRYRTVHRLHDRESGRKK